MTKTFIGQSPYDVCCALFGPTTADNFSSTSLHCYCSSSCRWGKYEIDFTIIGESHFVIIHDKDTKKRLTVEVYACVDTTRIGKADVSDTLLAGSMTHKFVYKDVGIETQASIREGFYVRSASISSVHTQVGFLEYAFDDQKHHPRTQVGIYGVHDHIIETKTLHEYITADETIVPLYTTTQYHFH